MKLPRYQLQSGNDLFLFEFISEGPKGKIHKLIEFLPTNQNGLVNLAFGDKDPQTGEIDDTVISNNGDSEKILATVVSSVYAFSNRYPDKWIYAAGSTRSRTRLYRIGITKHLALINKDFDIYGLMDDDWEYFRKNANYDGFLVIRKKH